MLVLVGMGLWDESDITLRGLEEVKTSDLIYLETYTSKLFGATKKNLEGLFGKKIQIANREFIEKGDILNYAVSHKVALLIPGDPLVATTHTDLLLRAREKGIPTKIVHNASIYSAVAETGLQMYKFGRSATVTFWEDKFKPTSFYDILKENKKGGLHTLFFLDIKADENRYMLPQEAMRILLECAKLDYKKRKAFTEKTDVIVCSRIGSEKRSIKYGPVKKIKDIDFGDPLHIMIVPGKLHDMEQKYLENFLWLKN